MPFYGPPFTAAMCVLARAKLLRTWQRSMYRYICMGGEIRRMPYEQIITLIKNEPVVTVLF
jgi:hypothetical protein